MLKAEGLMLKGKCQQLTVNTQYSILNKVWDDSNGMVKWN